MSWNHRFGYNLSDSISPRPSRLSRSSKSKTGARRSLFQNGEKTEILIKIFTKLIQVRHTECDIVSQEAKQCEACTRYQPVAKQFQEQCLSLSKLQQPLIAPNGDKSENEKPSEKVEEVIKQVILYFRP